MLNRNTNPRLLLIFATLCFFTSTALAQIPISVLKSKTEPASQTEEQVTTTTTQTAIQTNATSDTLEQISGYLDKTSKLFSAISITQWALAFFSIFGGMILQRIILFVLSRKVLKYTKETRFGFDEVFVRAITRPLGYLPFILGLVMAGTLLKLGRFSFFQNAAATALVLNFSWMLYNLVDVVTNILEGLADRTDTKFDDQLVPLVSKALRIMVILMSIVMLGSWVGGPFKGILAGLGLGGLAFALAAKDTIANLFGYVVIFADRPFLIGDTVTILGFKGAIEEVGIRSVKIRTYDKTLVSIPNNEVANSTIENFTARTARMVEMMVGLTYDTTADQMLEMVEAIREIIIHTEGVEPTPPIVGWQDFGASSLDIRIRFWTIPTSIAPWLEVRTRINMQIFKAIEDRGLSMAFPTRTLYLQQDPTGQAVFPGESADRM